ncbi:hypothetical protein ACSBR1_000869 [Camellia fascicularis]
MSSSKAQQQTHSPCPPHAVCIPYPAQGHINPMLKLAKLLHHKGFHITFINTEFNHRRLLKSQGPHSLSGTPSFHFQTIPDGLPPSDADATQDILALSHSILHNFIDPFRVLLAKLNDNAAASSEVPPVTCVVSDWTMSFTLKVGEELGIPVVFFFPTSATALMAHVAYPKLIEKGLAPLKDASYLTNGYLDTVIDWIPGMNGIRLKDLPSFIRAIDIKVDFVLEVIDKANKGSAIIFNTFDALEPDVLEALSTMYPPIYTIGPLQFLLDQFPQNHLNSIGSSLWKEEIECLSWLDSKEHNSVIYVNFGSITVMTPQHLIEFAWGLANSNQTFLWVIRPDLVIGDSAILLPDFVNETKERSLLASWCPQEQVLNHPSVGGFLTHCGWNSTLESICNGIPMLCWPFFADQQTNCWSCCSQWGVGMEINSDVKREEVDRMVRELMGGEKGKEMKRKVMEWKKLTKEATARSVGSSYLNFEKLVRSVLMSTGSNQTS